MSGRTKQILNAAPAVGHLRTDVHAASAISMMCVFAFEYLNFSVPFTSIQNSAEAC